VIGIHYSRIRPILESELGCVEMGCLCAIRSVLCRRALLSTVFILFAQVECFYMSEKMPIFGSITILHFYAISSVPFSVARRAI
jgi:hypothetical protein